MSAEPISTIIIVGGGIVGWSAAAAIRRKLPAIHVIVVPVAPPSDALADRIGCTLPSIVGFHGDLGLREQDTVFNAGSSLRLGTRFEGWSPGPDYVHAYGEYGQAHSGAAFYHHWLRVAREEQPVAYGAYSLAAALADKDRFVSPETAADDHLTPFTFGLSIQPNRYREMMRAFALHLGAEERLGSVERVQLRDDGFIESLVVDGTEIRADLFVDASGPQALLRSKVDPVREDWRDYFVADRVQLGSGEATGEPNELDSVIAFVGGWRWETHSGSTTTKGVVYSSAQLTDEHARDLIGGDVEPLTLEPGRLAQPWIRNCVAIGDAAVSIEPLEWTNLHLAHSAIDRLVAMMPDRDCNPVELWDYNRQVNAEADRVRDFVLLHYAIADRAEPFWQEAAARTLPASLQHTLTQWRERGRLPFYEEETFSRDSWAAVLIGQGVIPRRTDPLLDSVPLIESKRAMDQIRMKIRHTVTQAPHQNAYLRTLAPQETR